MRDMKQERQAQGLALVTPQPGWWEYLDKDSLPFRTGGRIDTEAFGSKRVQPNAPRHLAAHPEPRFPKSLPKNREPRTDLFESLR